MSTTLIIVGIIAVVLAFIWATYNSLVKLREMVRGAWADIDVQLKKRYDLLPDLVETARKATAVDEDILTKVTELRSKAMEEATKNASPQERAKVEGQISSMMRDIKVQVEAYPDIKSHAELNNLMEKVTDIEEKIAYARRYYNGVVKEYNTKLKVFPNVLFASLLGFKEEDFFAASEEEREDVKVDLSKKDKEKDKGEKE